jgi:nucleotide-binding universal stress UspA family protein
MVERRLALIALRNVLVATDFSEPADAALRYGMELARRFEAALHVLHVVNDLAVNQGLPVGAPVDTGRLVTTLEDEAHANLASLVTEPDRSALRAKLVVTVSGAPATAILGYARDESIDLIIVGTHGRQGLSHFFLGSVAEHVSRAAQSPVLIVRAHQRDFVHPDALQTVSTPESRNAAHGQA